MLLELNDENLQEPSLIELMKKAGELCLIHEGVPHDDDSVEVSVSFIAKDEIREINLQYRDKDSITDVLSFPQYESQEEMLAEEYLCIGDVIICPERAAEQAEEYGHSYEREMVYLMVHSMFHLLGYDHMTEEDKKEMREKEEAVMEEMGITR